MASSFRLGELADRVGGTVRGDRDRPIRRIATLDRAEPDDLSFLTHPRYRNRVARSRAGALLVAPGLDITGCDLLEVDDPYLALSRLLDLFHPAPPRRAEISPTASLGRELSLGREVAIGPYAVIEDDVTLGDEVTVGAGAVVGRASHVGQGSELKPGVVLYPETHVGRNCLIHSGVVLGADGFGFAEDDGRRRKMLQVGNVVLEDEVEIGANSTIDRGTLDETLIRRGTKIDNLVMIAHGVQIGPDAVLAGQAGVSGSTRIGAGVVFAGQSGAAGHLEIADGTVVAAKSAVFKSIPERAFVAGVPAVDHRIWKRSQALVRKLPRIQEELRELRTRLAALESRRPTEE